VQILARPIIAHQLMSARYCLFHLYQKHVFHIKSTDYLVDTDSNLYCSNLLTAI
jgi:hypothetical protein